MSTSDDYNRGKELGQKDSNQQKATEQQMPNAEQRNAFNAGVHHGQGKS